MSPIVVFGAMSVGILGYMMMFGTKPANVRMVEVASRKYRVTHTAANTWRIERLGDGLVPTASATYKYGQDLSETMGNTELLKQLAGDIMVFPASLFS